LTLRCITALKKMEIRCRNLTCWIFISFVPLRISTIVISVAPSHYIFVQVSKENKNGCLAHIYGWWSEFNTKWYFLNSGMSGGPSSLKPNNSQYFPLTYVCCLIDFIICVSPDLFLSIKTDTLTK
jgi:hypothetical protein